MRARHTRNDVFPFSLNCAEATMLQRIIWAGILIVKRVSYNEAKLKLWTKRHTQRSGPIKKSVCLVLL